MSVQHVCAVPVEASAPLGLELSMIASRLSSPFISQCLIFIALLHLFVPGIM